MQAYAVQVLLVGLPGLCVCYKFLIETTTDRHEYYVKLHSLNIFKLMFRCLRGECCDF
jgi:hypothetical protein